MTDKEREVERIVSVISPVSNTTEVWDIAEALVNAGIRSKEGFEIAHNYTDDDEHPNYIKPRTYKEE